MTFPRIYHSSATTEEAVLLIGGSSSKTTEWIPVDGSTGQQGGFSVRHGWGHCTVQLSDDIIWLTGGHQTNNYVTQYSLADRTVTPLTPLGQPRYQHACGVYQDAGGQQVILITGGWDAEDGNFLSSTEVAIYTSDSQLEWMEMESGHLPTPRRGMKAAVIDNDIYVTGGEGDDYNDLTEILRWDPSAESWQQAGSLAVARSYHAAVAIPSSIIESEC